MEIRILNDIYTDQNTYFLEENGKAIVIDPGSSFEKVKEFAGKIKIEYVLLTHCHYDHITSVNEIRENLGAKLCCTEECAQNIKNPDISLTEMGLGKRIFIDTPDIFLTSSEDFDFHGNKIKIIKTPGHTSCSTIFLTDGNMFSGDTIFFQSVGRCDLPTGNYETLEKSIKEKIYSLPEEIKIYPGHGRSTTVGYEKKYNLFIRKEN